jgi:hypothetical protein
VDSRVSPTTLKVFFGILLWKESWFEYVRGIRKNIQNDKPIIGHYDVNNEGSSDMYIRCQYAAYFTPNCK